MLLKGFLHSDRIEEELAFILGFLRIPKTFRVIAGRLRHVISPFLIQGHQLLEFLLEIIVSGSLGALAFICAGFIRQFLEDGVRLHFLLHEIAQLEQGRLEDEQALLKLRRKNLLEGKALRLVHSLSGHTPSLPVQPATSKLCSGRRVACLAFWDCSRHGCRYSIQYRAVTLPPCPIS